MASGTTEQPTPDRPALGVEIHARTSLHVRRAMDGDADSLSWLVERLSPLLWAQAEYRLGPELRAIYDPQDLVHDAWLVALPRLATLPARDGRFTPVLLRFLSTAIVYRIQNVLRKHANRRGGIVMEVDTEEAGAREVRDLHSGAITQAIRNERRDQVLTAIRSLGDRDREILMLRGIEQMSNDTVSMLLRMKKQSVSIRYQRALERLRDRLPGSVFEELARDDG